MTLLISVFAAVISTVIWYVNNTARKLYIGSLCYMFWGASIMWFVDAVAEYIELRDAFFNPSLESMINDSFLGFAVVALALVIWVIIFLSKDPLGTLKGMKQVTNEDFSNKVVSDR